MKNLKVQLSNGENENLFCMANEVDWSSAVNDWLWLFAQDPTTKEWVWVDWEEAPEYFEL